MWIRKKLDKEQLKVESNCLRLHDMLYWAMRPDQRAVDLLRFMRHCRPTVFVPKFKNAGLENTWPKSSKDTQYTFKSNKSWLFFKRKTHVTGVIMLSKWPRRFYSLPMLKYRFLTVLTLLVTVYEIREQNWFFQLKN